MIKLGGKPLLLENLRGELRKFMDVWFDLDDARFLCPLPPGRMVQRAENILYPTYADPPRMRLNSWYVPSGASRHSFGLFLVDKKTASDIYQAHQANSAITLELSAPAESSGKQTLTFQVFALPPRPVVQFLAKIDAAEQETQASEELRILPIVDLRYFWNWYNVGEITEQTFADWDEIFDYCESQHEDVLDLHQDGTRTTDFQLPDLTSKENNWETLGVILDSLAWSAGARVVPFAHDPDTTKFHYGLVNPSDGWTDFYEQNRTGSISTPDGETHKWARPKFTAGGMGFEVDDLNGLSLDGQDPRFPLPDSITVVYPDSDGGLHHDVEVTAQDLIDDGHFDAIDGLSGAPYVLRGVTEYDGSNGTELTDQAKQMALDHYWQMACQYDIVIAGLQGWQLSGLDDALLYQLDMLPDGGFRPTTRVWTHPHDFTALPVNPGGGNSVSIIRFSIVSRDCTTSPISALVTVLDQECGSSAAEGEDAYGRVTVWDANACDLGSIAEVDVAGTKGWAIRMNNSGSCRYEILRLCCSGECD